jgi:anti-sigma regulatory factor (Ser/Thr protein kinase)
MAHLAIAPQLDELGRAGSWLAEWARPHGLDDERLYALRLCLEEVLANIVMHGDNGATPIEIDLALTADEVVMTVSDGGRPFDPSLPAAPGAPDAIGGHGLTLIRSYASRLDYRRQRDGNRLELRFSATATHGAGN